MHYTIFTEELFTHSRVATTSTKKTNKKTTWLTDPTQQFLCSSKAFVKNYSHPRNPLINHMSWCWREPICQHKTQSALPVKRLQNANMANYAILCCFGERWCLDNGFKTHLNGTQIQFSPPRLLWTPGLIDRIPKFPLTCMSNGEKKKLEGLYKQTATAGSCLSWGARSSLMWPLGLSFI